MFRRASVALACLFAVCGGVAGDESLRRYQREFRQMGTRFHIVVYAMDESKALEAMGEASARVDDLNAMMSDYLPQSELSRLGAVSGTGDWVAESAPLWSVIGQAQTLSERSGGAFDITVGPLMHLWRATRRNGRLPGAARLAEARAATGYRHLRLDRDRRSVRLEVPGMRLDLGGIAKGYAVDEALRTLRARGIEIAMVDGGGDLRVMGAPPRTIGWQIGVSGLGGASAPAGNLRLRDVAVATSGDLHKSIRIGDREFSHILDPRTGLGLEERKSVTVIAPDCATADALASALSVMPSKEAEPLLDRHYPEVSARVTTRRDGLRTVELGRRFAWPALGYGAGAEGAAR